ncbi:hypothetical protein [Stygiolobus caldivivus]|uniref:Uncharacterized protein n=1 Tax=Stygiolobus caldivivus TaxID=2824673 RepID=A0A8D5U742_9CREN|nr:hypothetical protein [Stygiolobus caldivivus]BCU70193.1 hypothetical protein KN1_14900 [Stygiolobus caldivivus]
MKGLATSIALIIFLFILLSILIPAFFIMYNTPYYSNQGSVAAQAYQQQKELELNNIFRGNPEIYYSSGTSPYVQIKVQTVQTPINITQIYYFNGSTWVPTLNSSVGVYGSMVIPLPSKAFNEPVVIVTALSNVLFLNPNTSVSTSNVIGPTGKIPVYVVAIALNKTSSGYVTLPVSTCVQFGSTLENTPYILYVDPGTYSVSAKDTQIFLSEYGLTGQFLKWEVTGTAQLSSNDTPSTVLTVNGPTILTLFYNTSLKHYKVKILFSCPDFHTPLPIEGVTKDPNTGATLVNVNRSLPVYVDNHEYFINYTNPSITLCLTYGFHTLTYPSTFYLVFNYTLGKTTIPYGEMIEYTLVSSGVHSSNGSAIKICNPNEFKVMGSGTVYIPFNPQVYYYLVIANNSFSLPQGVSLQSNSTPICGDIAAQLLRADIIPPKSSGYPSETIVIGPSKSFTNEEFYVPSGTRIDVTYFYLEQIAGQFTISNNNYNSLLSEPCFFEIENASYTPSNVYVFYYTPNNVYPPIYVYSPTIIAAYSMWEYAGYPPSSGGGVSSNGGGI